MGNKRPLIQANKSPHPMRESGAGARAATGTEVGARAEAAFLLFLLFFLIFLLVFICMYTFIYVYIYICINFCCCCRIFYLILLPCLRWHGSIPLLFLKGHVVAPIRFPLIPDRLRRFVVGYLYADTLPFFVYYCYYGLFPLRDTPFLMFPDGFFVLLTPPFLTIVSKTGTKPEKKRHEERRRRKEDETLLFDL